MARWTPGEWMMVILSGTAITMWILAAIAYWIQDKLGWKKDDSIGTFGCAWLITSFIFVFASAMVWVKS